MDFNMSTSINVGALVELVGLDIWLPLNNFIFFLLCVRVFCLHV